MEFFLVFSRAEYALKNAGFARGDDNWVTPDWDGFAESLRDRFQKNRSNELRQATEYILNNPPMKQVFRQNSLMWETNLPNGNLSDIEKLIRLVRRIRNNLFHGGKHNVALFEDAERSTHLLTSSLVIIHECLSLTPQVKMIYDEAII